MRRVALCGALVALALTTAASGAVQPKGRYYRADLSSGKHLKFDYIAHPPPTVHYLWIERKEGTRTHSFHFSGTAYVHTAKFTFHGYSHLLNQELEVIGQWTSAEVVEGIYKEGNAESKHFRAHWTQPASGGGPNRAAASTVAPTPGHWKGPLPHASKATIRFQHFAHP